MNIQDRITKYLTEEEDIDDDEMEFDDVDYINDAEIMNKMVDFIISLDVDSLSESKQEELMEIVDLIAGPDEEDLEEAVGAKRQKIDRAARRQRKREYRKKRAQIKLKLKKYRRTAKFKKYERMKKRKAKQGKTSTGKRVRTFI